MHAISMHSFFSLSWSSFFLRWTPSAFHCSTFSRLGFIGFGPVAFSRTPRSLVRRIGGRGPPVAEFGPLEVWPGTCPARRVFTGLAPYRLFCSVVFVIMLKVQFLLKLTKRAEIKKGMKIWYMAVWTAFYVVSDLSILAPFRGSAAFAGNT